MMLTTAAGDLTEQALLDMRRQISDSFAVMPQMLHVAHPAAVLTAEFRSDSTWQR